MDKSSKKCANCGGNLVFSPKQNALLCEKCSSNTAIDLDKSKVIIKHDILDVKNLSTVKVEGGEANCPSCGAVVTNSKQLSNVCPYCGSNMVVNVKQENAIKCDAVIPFKIDKSELKDVYEQKIKHKHFIPNKLKKCPENSRIEAFYIPAFGFDASTINTYAGRLGKTYTDSNGNSRTKYFKISGTKQINIKDNLVETSSKLNQYDLDNIRPYNIKQSVPYNPDFIRGYSVEHYDKNLKDCFSASRISMKKIISDTILSGYSYDCVDYLNVDSSFSEEKYCQYILPVYQLNFNYKNKNYTTFVNGQTGKIGSGIPKSAVKITFTVIFAILIFLAIVLLPMLLN